MFCSEVRKSSMAACFGQSSEGGLVGAMLHSQRRMLVLLHVSERFSEKYVFSIQRGIGLPLQVFSTFAVF